MATIGNYGKGKFGVRYEDGDDVQTNWFETLEAAEAWLAEHPGGEIVLEGEPCG